MEAVLHELAALPPIGRPKVSRHLQVLHTVAMFMSAILIVAFPPVSCYRLVPLDCLKRREGVCAYLARDSVPIAPRGQCPHLASSATGLQTEPYDLEARHEVALDNR
jgi:hypothetical protein